MAHSTQATQLFSYPRYWAECFGPAPFLPMSRAEMDQLGWDSCDIIIVCGDAYVDHPSFGMAVIGRFLEAQGFRVGLICQPDWTSADPFKALGKPNLFFGVSGGNMDSMINRYTADKKVRNDDAYTPGGVGGKRPDRCVLVYSQRCKEAYSDVPVVLGGIEASLRRIAQYDYWSDQVRRSVLIDATADILLYGNAERAIADIAHGLAAGKTIEELSTLRGTTVIRKAPPSGWTEIDSSRIDWPGNIDKLPNPYEYQQDTGNDANNTQVGLKAGEGQLQASSAPCQQNQAANPADEVQPVRIIPMPLAGRSYKDPNTYIRLPSFEKVRNDPVLYAHASRVLHQEANPFNARPLIQKHGNREIWVNPPPMPLETDELDGVFDLPYQRRPHPSYGNAKIPAYEMIKTSINIMRGCFGGCTFCSITEHEGRIIQSRSEESILREIEDIREKVPGFTGHISDLGGPTANMYRLQCKDLPTLSACRRLSCVFPTICKNLGTDHKHTTQLYRKARAIPGVKRVSIASGLRYDLAVRDPEYVKELVTHHVGGMLKIAPEHTEGRPLDMMMKPSMESYYAFKKLFDKYSKEAGKTQYLVPYFIAAHPGTEDEDMLSLALWLKKNNFEVDQVQTFYPSPMSLATAMYFSQRNPLKKLSYKKGSLYIPRDKDQRKLHKALLRYHDPSNWGFLRESLIKMNKAHLIDKLLPSESKNGRKQFVQGGARQKASGNKFDKIPARKPQNPRRGKPRSKSR
ncbi:YgiQ family radical SAM protein [Simiduia aestuariiviva]|uniref:Putative radical SAM protein YgiQ n=1 Tax=Simiduia aestuariiviva TaxID=1510459 RepID=A0A839UJ45_9GAMM|nr:YgiQ family radical SAM protein [Simiduia aestuariiviva]MBB3168114.1 putative radical SAM protein YgiQ [Simiduia aestuariiviva]